MEESKKHQRAMESKRREIEAEVTEVGTIELLGMKFVTNSI